MLKWKAFLGTIDVGKFQQFRGPIKSLQVAISSNDFAHSKITFQTCLLDVNEIRSAYEEFSKTCIERSEMARYLDGLLKLISILKNLIAADKEGNWRLHLLFFVP